MILFDVAPDPASVVAGWIPLVLIAVLAVAMVVIYRSLRKQLHRIDIPDEGIPTRGARREPTDRAEQTTGSNNAERQ